MLFHVPQPPLWWFSRKPFILLPEQLLSWLSSRMTLRNWVGCSFRTWCWDACWCCPLRYYWTIFLDSSQCIGGHLNLYQDRIARIEGRVIFKNRRTRKVLVLLQSQSSQNPRYWFAGVRWLSHSIYSFHRKKGFCWKRLATGCRMFLQS